MLQVKGPNGIFTPLNITYLLFGSFCSPKYDLGLNFFFPPYEFLTYLMQFGF